jgi:hypothetical protein
MLRTKVEGDKELANAMRGYAKLYARKAPQDILQKSAHTAMRAGAAIAQPGDKDRQLVAASQRTRDYRVGKISKRTDTTRSATHFVKFLRQNKRPFFVPVTLNPVEKNQNVQAWDRNRKAKRRKWALDEEAGKNSGVQRTRDGTRNVYDSASQVRAMRKIGRRGLAQRSFFFLGQEAGKKTGARGVGNARRQSALRKWTKVTKRFKPMNSSISMHNKLTYLQDAYSGIENRISGKAAKMMNAEVRNRIAKMRQNMSRGRVKV